MGKHYGLDIPTLHELRIDVDKEWVDENGQPRGISNIKEIAQAMATGHTTQFDGLKLIKLLPGIENYVLTSQGPGKLVVWAPAGSYFFRFFPVTIELAHAEQIVTVDQSHNKNAPITTWNRQNCGDAPADYIKRLTPTIALPDAEDIVTVDKSHNKNAPVASQGGVQLLVDGAVADDGGVQTDETTEARNPTVDDMTLLPAAPVVDDAYYFGFTRTWDKLLLNVSTAGVGNWGLAHEYWTGATWAALSDVVDETSEFTIAGTNKIQFTRPGDWALTTILGMNLYWIRARVVSFFNITTQPLGAQAWCERFV